MKYLIILSLFITNLAFANGAKDIHHALIEGVNTDIKKDNVQDLKDRPSRTRGPASVDSSREYQEESILEKKERQLGSKKW